MTLRTRLFLLLASLATALVLAQWFWVRSLAKDLREEVGLVAVRVGETVASVLTDPSLDGLVHDVPIEERVERAGSGQEQKIVFRRFETSGQLPEGVHRILDGSRDTRELLGECGGDGLEGAEADCPEADLVESGPTSANRTSTFSWVFDVSEEEEERHLVLHVETEDELRTFEVEGSASGAFVVPDEGEESGRERRTVVRQFVTSAGSPEELHGALPLVHRIPLPERGIQERLDTFARQSFVGAGLLLALGIGLAGLIAHRVTAPLGRLATAARDLGGGALGRQVDAGGETGEVAEAIGAFNQMSSRLEKLDARARAFEQEKHLAEIGEIARGLAHALRNPLNALGLAVETLAMEAEARDGEDVEGRIEASQERARRQIRRVDAAVRSFLVLASEGAGAVVAADVSQLVRDVALEAHQDAAGRVRLQVDAPDATRLDLVEAEVRAVLQALVVNAIEASPEGEIVEIRVVAEDTPEGSGVCILVEDRGPGLPANVRERLFSPHVSTKSHGSGMGLFLAHRIAVGRYGGRLDVLDREGGGTTAALHLGSRTERGSS